MFSLLRLLHWRVDSLLLSHLGCPVTTSESQDGSHSERCSLRPVNSDKFTFPRPELLQGKPCSGSVLKKGRRGGGKEGTKEGGREEGGREEGGQIHVRIMCPGIREDKAVGE